MCKWYFKYIPFKSFAQFRHAQLLHLRVHEP